MKKIIIFNLVILLTPVIAGVYGMLHDQLTYSISPEYFTKFKFEQFGLTLWDSQAITATPRLAVAKVGWMATWWTGLFIGIPLAITACFFKSEQRMIKVIGISLLVTLGITFATGLIGLAYGKLVLANTGVDWWLPDDLVDKTDFIAVGSMHNFSYLGGFFGLCAALFYMAFQLQKQARGL